MEAAFDWEPEYFLFECATCGIDFDMILDKASQIDEAVQESGHQGHDWAMSPYSEE
jgi:hypothetical protein